jgi:hypothetical protein
LPALASALALVTFAVSCGHTAESTNARPPPRTLDRDEVAQLIPKRVADRAGWADDVIVAIRLTDKVPTPERVCAVLAVVEQESGYRPDPAVRNLPAIVRRGLADKLDRLGPLREPALGALLAGRAPGAKHTFGERIARLRTERDLDRFFRDVTRSYEAQMPGSFAVARALSATLGRGGIESLNPVTTAGSMQVKVSFARELGRAEGLDDDDVRELLYTRGGGVRFGTARLIGYPARYTDIVHRFADFNAGVYASRNAAFQEMLADLTGRDLALDGDLLLWDERGEPLDQDSKTLGALLAFGAAHDLSQWRVRKDARKEKSLELEETKTWTRVREAWQEKHGRAPPYARVPDVTLSSPKLSRELTTAWFADRVNRRYLSCRTRVSRLPG